MQTMLSVAMREGSPGQKIHKRLAKLLHRYCLIINHVQMLQKLLKLRLGEGAPLRNVRAVTDSDQSMFYK